MPSSACRRRSGGATATARLTALTGGFEDVLPADADDPEASAALRPIHDEAVANGRRVIDAARDGDALEALGRLSAFRVLCAHRRGPCGVSTWMPRIESWLAASVADFAADETWYVGRRCW